MARLSVEDFEKIEKSNHKEHKKVVATYSIIQIGEKKMLQIDTYGTIDRAFPDKCSQSIQIDESMARHLICILKEHNII